MTTKDRTTSATIETAYWWNRLWWHVQGERPVKTVGHIGKLKVGQLTIGKKRITRLVHNHGSTFITVWAK